MEDDNLIACCGLYCGDCHGFLGRIPNPARDLGKELRISRSESYVEIISTYSFGKDFRNFDDC